MILDTSAIVAITRGEPGTDRYMDAIRQASTRRISAGNLLEAYMVIDGAGNSILSQKLDAVIVNLRMVIEPVTVEQIRIAREAFHQYGKGSGHPARLNYGDCFAYSLARMLDEPLRFVGNDFAETDIGPEQDRYRGLAAQFIPTSSKHRMSPEPHRSWASSRSCARIPRGMPRTWGERPRSRPCAVLHLICTFRRMRLHPAPG